MKAAGYQLSVLWGDRMRYLHYGWELVGCRVDWTVDRRMVAATGATAVPLRGLEFDRDLPAITRAWNAETVGTIHSPETLRGVLSRPAWTTSVADMREEEAFAVHQWEGEDLIVNKLVASPAMLPRLLLALADLSPRKPANVRVQAPPWPHPLGEAAARFASGMVLRPVCNARVINPTGVAELQQATDPAGMRRMFGSPAQPSPKMTLWIEGPSAV
jgi:hypothetical protein